MKLSPAMEDALKGARPLTESGELWLPYFLRRSTRIALRRRGLSVLGELTPAGIAERERLLK